MKNKTRLVMRAYERNCIEVNAEGGGLVTARLAYRGRLYVNLNGSGEAKEVRDV